MSDSDSFGRETSSFPSSFDATPDFFEESRVQKLWRKLRQEPLIPVGCAATCYALYMATKSIRAGDHHQTNRMFRARIYAQGFTLLALVAGSIFYKDERLKRKAFETALEEKKVEERREKWLRELEARDREDRELQEKIMRDAKHISKDVAGSPDLAMASPVAVDAEPSTKPPAAKSSWQFWNRSVADEVERMGWGAGTWAQRTRVAWRRF